MRDCRITTTSINPYLLVPCHRNTRLSVSPAEACLPNKRHCCTRYLLQYSRRGVSAICAAIGFRSSIFIGISSGRSIAAVAATIRRAPRLLYVRVAIRLRR